MDETIDAGRAGIARRAEELFEQHRRRHYEATDRVFAWLMIGQWIFAVALAILISPYAWAGRVHVLHLHVKLAVLLGGALSSLPILLVRARPGSALTRHVIAASQLLWSALLIHLSGGRIETHFHVFGSLAFLAFYRDYRVLVTATLVVAADHFIRGLLFPESVYGVLNPEWWRFLEHAFWVAFEDVVLVMACLRAVLEMRDIAWNHAEIEAITALERTKSDALDLALVELRRSQDLLVRREKLAAIGELAASVGHELRNPLTAIANANAYVSQRLSRAPMVDARVAQFLGIVDQQVESCGKIIGDLLDFARERPLALAPCPLAQLVDEALSLVPERARVAVRNEVPRDLPIPTLDKDQFRQILVNLVQNAVEAIPEERPGVVVISAGGGAGRPLEVRVADDGVGIPGDVADRVFQPLFTTKSRGTGLGLAIVANMVQKHAGSIRLDTEVGRGSTFIIELPAGAAPATA